MSCISCKGMRCATSVRCAECGRVERSPLESRITALTAELEQARAYAAKADESLLDCATAHATERAAREKAEADRDQAIADEKSEIALRTEQEALVSRLIVEKRQAERERDAALARVEELERAQISPDAYMPREEVARLGIAQKALADWENGLPEPWRTYVMSLETNANPSGNIRDAFCQRQNAEALAARVRELEISETALKGMVERQALNSHDLREEKENWVKRAYCAEGELEAAETALASARELLLRFMANTTLHNNEPLWEGLELDIRAWLTSHPAPVAAPERGTRDVVETAIDLTKDDKHSRWNALMARTAELPVTVMATSEYPSPAPCPGCEELKAKLERARTELETAAGYDTTRIRRALEVLR